MTWLRIYLSLYRFPKLLIVQDDFQFQNLPNELEARWRLVETAWDLNISPNLLEVEYDDSLQFLNINILDESIYDRKNVTSCRDALNGYQKGKCFYCFEKISIKLMKTTIHLVMSVISLLGLPFSVYLQV